MATMTYTGAGNVSTWSDPKNWKGGVAPGASDTALLQGGANSTVTAPVIVNNVMILSSQSITFDSAVSTYGVGNCKGFMVCESGTATFAPGSSLIDGGVLQVGVEATGTFVATGTTTHATKIQAKRTQIGVDAAGIGSMTIDNASMTDTAGLFVGEAGKGNLTIQGGGHVMTDNMTVGTDSGGTGQVLLLGATLTVTGTASIGGVSKGVIGGTGTISVGAGSVFHAMTEIRVATGSSASLNDGTMSAGDKEGGINVMVGGAIAGHGSLTTRVGAGFKIDGLLEAKGGLLDVQGGLTGTGTLTIDAGSTATVDGKWLLLPKIDFAGAGSTLVLAKGVTVAAEIDNFSLGDSIKMAGVASASWNPTTHTLALTSAGRTVDGLRLAGTFTGERFAVTQQNGMGIITLQHV